MIPAFSAPALIKAWGIGNMAVLGPVFSANLAGIFFGSPGFGYIGDRWGRKFALALACLVLAVFAFAGIWATSIPQLIVYRFIAGLGMGGVFPLAIALSTEFAPKKLRATMVGVFFFGQTFGSGTPVAVSLWLMPTYGWQSFYIVGGISATVALILTALWVPESIKFLVLKGGYSSRAAAMLSAMGLSVAPSTRLIVTGEKAYAAFSPKQLFSEGLAPLTLLVWVMFVCNMLVFYFTNMWLPTVLTTANITVGHAAIATWLFQTGGAIGCVVVGPLVDRKGVWPVAILFVVAMPIVGLLGYSSAGRQF